MAASMIASPPDRGYNGDDNFVKFATNLHDVDTGAVIYLVISSTGPSVGQVLTIEWAGKTVVFTVAATTNAEATAWPVKSGLETLAEYVERVRDAIRHNSIITTDWAVSCNTTTITLSYRDWVALPITVTEDLANVAESHFDGADSIQQPNLSCLVQLWKVDAAAPDDVLLGSLQSPYNGITGITEFDLKDYFLLEPHLPEASSIDPGLITEWPHGVASKAYLQYYLRYNDKYGTPAVPLGLVKSDPYYMLHGARSADHDDSSVLGFVFPAYQHRRRDGGIFRKPLTEGMIDYVYFWAAAELTDCNIFFLITWSGGTTTTVEYGGDPFTLEANKLHWMPSTPYTFDYPAPTAGEFPERITFQLKGDGGTGLVTMLDVKYEVRVTPDWQYWILFDNGLAGCETALFMGKGKRGINVTRDTARRPRSSTFSISDGEVFSTNVEAQRGYELSTGWLERYQVEHLQQLLLGDCWLIDQPNSRFIKLVCESSNVLVSEDDKTLFSIEASFKLAFYDTSINL